ncbi:hypothetical protein V8G54_031509, partial [Vigna mungo]
MHSVARAATGHHGGPPPPCPFSFARGRNSPCSRMHQPPRAMVSSTTASVTGAAAQAVAKSTVRRRDRRRQPPQLLPSSFFAFLGGSRLSPYDIAAVLAGDASSPA